MTKKEINEEIKINHYAWLKKQLKRNHYRWLEKHLPQFFEDIGLSWKNNQGIISAHGDKGYTYRDLWEKNNIPFNHGIAIYLLSYCDPFWFYCRRTHKKEWLPVEQWVIDNYCEFKEYLADPEDY